MPSIVVISIDLYLVEELLSIDELCYDLLSMMKNVILITRQVLKTF